MKEKVRGQQLKKILYIIFTLALFITFTIKGEGGDGTLSEGGKAREGYREIRGMNGEVGASPDI